MTSFVIADFNGVSTRDLQHYTWPTQSELFCFDLDKANVQLLLSLLVSICWPYVDTSGLPWLVYGSCLIFQENAPFTGHYDTRWDFVRGAAHLRSRSFPYHNHYRPNQWFMSLNNSTGHSGKSGKWQICGRFGEGPGKFVDDLQNKKGKRKDWSVLCQPAGDRLIANNGKFCMDAKVPESARSAPPIFIRIFLQTNFSPSLSFSKKILKSCSEDLIL